MEQLSANVRIYHRKLFNLFDILFNRPVMSSREVVYRRLFQFWLIALQVVRKSSPASQTEINNHAQ